MAGNTGTLGQLERLEPEPLDSGTAAFQVQADATKYVMELGLPMPQLSADGYRGEMPVELTSLDDEKLGDLLARLSTFIGYADTKVTEANIACKAAEARLDFVKARVRIGLKAMAANLGRLTTKDKDDIIETDPRVIDARSDALYTESIYLLSRSILKKSERDWDTVSRRITQRGQEVERMKREGNIAGVPQAARTFRRPGP
jgi:hypothetical protein